ncbi:Xaa-Pro aminopeptidase [Candidatus Spongiihabitans sp.]|uniref:Xaa-Pro aminopeptidase n=1 Tax=Candidatus Spongiihabitans sp. TaxID=3101308 RepID=UPI003C6FCEA5
MTADAYQRRRQDLMHFIGDGIAILTTARHQMRNGDVLFQFRPDSDFYYLTHFSEPEAVAVFIPGGKAGEFLLFCREKDAAKEQWDGRRAGLEGAVSDYGADQAFPIDQLQQKLPELLDNRDKVYTMMGRYPEFDSELLDCINTVRRKRRCGARAPGEYVDVRHILHEMRIIKKKDEIKIMRSAAKLSAAAHRRAMQFTQPGKFEYQVQAEMECEFRLGGSKYNAYPSIVAGGANACILHYLENSCELHDGDLLLIDAGAEVDCYAADITRTFPVNGKYSGEQKALYEIVLAAQKAALNEVKPNNRVVEYHTAAVQVLTEGLVDIGLLDGEINELIETQAYQPFYMHRTGHWLGMDVHDVGDYKIDEQWRILEQGMVLTVEPGLYISAANDIDPKWHNIGIRIEDDVHVTRQGNEVLTKDVPKEINEIEELMARK